MSHALDDTFGVLFIGVVFSAALFGVSCVQAWFYFTNYPRDPWHVKLLVAAVFISDMVHQILISQTIYTYTITYYGMPEELGNIVPSIIIEVLFNGFTALMVQSFFVYRIWTLSGGNIYVTGVVSSLVVGEFACVVAYVAKGIQIPTYAALTEIKNLSMSINILAAAGDLIIAASMCALLHTSRTGFRQSDTIINRLMVFVINTGLLTSFDAVASLVSILAWPNTFIYICFYFALGRLYSNSLFATLNARSAIRAQTSGPGVSGEEISLSFQPARSTTVIPINNTRKTVEQMQNHSGKPHNQTFVVVEQTTVHHTDELDVRSISDNSIKKTMGSHAV